MKLSTNVKCTKKVAKSLRIGISRLKIETKEENYTITNTKGIILSFGAFHIYAHIFIFLLALANKLKV